MIDQSAQLQALEQALQEKGIDYQIRDATIDGRYKDTQITRVTVEIYDTGDQ